eukprot:2986131-Rhodomonas_salina.3
MVLPEPQTAYRLSRRRKWYGALSSYTPKSNTRNRTFSPKFTRNAVSCFPFRGVSSYALSMRCPVLTRSYRPTRSLFTVEDRFASIVLHTRYAMFSTDSPIHLLCAVPYWQTTY